MSEQTPDLDVELPDVEIPEATSVPGEVAEWPDSAPEQPDGWGAMTAEERADWLTQNGWDGAVGPDGMPTDGSPAWGDPMGPARPNDRTLGEPPSTRGRRMGGPEVTDRTEQDVKDAAKHGQVKGIGGGSAKRKRRNPLGAKVGRGDGQGRGFGGGLLSFHFFGGAFSGNSLLSTGNNSLLSTGNNSLIGGARKPSNRFTRS